MELRLRLMKVFLVPILVDEILPGDTFNLKMHAFARMATPIFPIMDNLYLESFFLLFLIVWYGITGRSLMVIR